MRKNKGLVRSEYLAEGEIPSPSLANDHANRPTRFAVSQTTATDLEGDDDLAWLYQIARPFSATRLGLARNIRDALRAHDALRSAAAKALKFFDALPVEHTPGEAAVLDHLAAALRDESPSPIESGN